MSFMLICRWHPFKSQPANILPVTKSTAFKCQLVVSRHSLLSLSEVLCKLVVIEEKKVGNLLGGQAADTPMQFQEGNKELEICLHGFLAECLQHKHRSLGSISIFFKMRKGPTQDRSYHQNAQKRPQFGFQDPVTVIPDPGI